MTAILHDNFDSDATGALTGFVNTAGSGVVVFDAAAQGISALLVSGAQMFGRFGDGDAAVYTANGTMATQGLRHALKVPSMASGTFRAFGHLLHAASSGDNAYRTYCDTSGGGTPTLVAKIVFYAGGSAVLASVDTGLSPTPNVDVVHYESLALAAGVLEFRVWLNSTTRPSSPTATATHTSYTSGYPGVRLRNSGGDAWTGLDDFVIADGASGLDYFYAPDTTAPVLSSPTGTATGSTTASGTVVTDEGNGTLYRLASTNATESAATIIAAALTTTVTATGSQAVTFTGLTASTTYYPHYVQKDAATNTSNVVNGASFTTSAVATGVTLTGPSAGVTGAASTNFTLGVTPIGGAITGTVIVTPSDGGAGGTFTPTTKSLTTGSPTGTFTYTAASAGAKTISVTNSGGLTNPSNITYTATSTAATATVVTGPSSGTVSVASTNFTASANGVITGTVIVTPSDGGVGGTFSPTTVSISSGSPTATFTYTAASSGAKSISFTNNGGLANQGNLTYTATTSGIANFAYSAPGKRIMGGMRTGVAHHCTVHDKSTRALLATKTGLTSDASTGAVSFTLVASGTIVAGTEYLLMPIADANDYDFGTLWVTAT